MSGKEMTKRYPMAVQLLFDEEQWRILSEFDAFAGSRPSESVERNSVAQGD